jgi:hypothetical protein
VLSQAYRSILAKFAVTPWKPSRQLPAGTPRPARAPASARQCTQEAEAYTPPDWSCDKILRIEKDGLWPVIEASRIAGRYDMAVVVSEGYSARRGLRADPRMAGAA